MYNRPIRWKQLWTSANGSAAVEFALVCPLLLTMCGGLADFGLLLWARHELASGVSQAAGYAFNTGPNVSGSAVANVVNAVSSLSSATVTVTGPACYCISGTPASLSSQTCGNSCADGATPGVYVTLAASYTYQPMLPVFSQLSSYVIQELATVRIQ